jgi:hypothetical protein
VPHTVPPATILSPSASDQVRSISRIFSGVFALICALMTLIVIGSLGAIFLYTGPNVRVVDDAAEHQAGYVLIGEPLTQRVLATSKALHEIPIRTRLVGMFTLVLFQWGTFAMVFWHLCHLFLLYGRGRIFEADNVSRIRHIGLWLILWGIAPTVSHQICNIAGITDTGWFRMSSVAGVLSGGILFVVARIMDLGRQIENERAGFV